MTPRPKRTAEQVYRYNRTAYCKAHYGLTSTQYAETLAARDNCEICVKPFGVERRRCLDHNHETGVVRGVLCDRCNQGIGLLGDKTRSTTSGTTGSTTGPDTMSGTADGTAGSMSGTNPGGTMGGTTGDTMGAPTGGTPGTTPPR